MSADPAPVPEPELAFEAQGLEHLRRGDGEAGAWCFLLAGRLALARGDVTRCTRCHAAATHALEGLTPTGSLGPNLLLIEAELAAAAGQLETSVELGTRAIAGFKAVGDRDGVVAVWTARAARALQGGQVDAAQVILEELLPHLDGRGDTRTGVFLRVRLAAALSRLGRRAAALEWLRAARDRSAEGSALRLTVVAEAMRVQLDDGQPEAALDLGAEALDQPEDAAPSSPEPTLHAEVLVLCAVALRQLGRPELAEPALARAQGFDSPGLVEARARLGLRTGRS
ncbi:MAG: hypothetical protein IT370_06980 [Deltaproteobacteria bacterium]|nr:hypothetical protein [Deltaproteobacteria bacterium]